MAGSRKGFKAFKRMPQTTQARGWGLKGEQFAKQSIPNIRANYRPAATASIAPHVTDNEELGKRTGYTLTRTSNERLENRLFQKSNTSMPQLNAPDTETSGSAPNVPASRYTTDDVMEMLMSVLAAQRGSNIHPKPAKTAYKPATRRGDTPTAFWDTPGFRP